jgi:O-antigen/teichoic acid export membrane protein
MRLGALLGLASSSAAPLILATVTAPIIARHLGPVGRGHLAAILVPLTIAPVILGLGLGHFITREVARGTPRNVLLGSLGAPLLVVGLLVAAVSSPLATVILGESSGDRHNLLRIGFLVVGVGLLADLLLSMIWGAQDWRRLTWIRLSSPLAYAAGVVILALTDSLTVTSLMLATWAGAALSVILAVAGNRRAFPAKFDPRVTRTGLAFGAQTWLGAISALGNHRLDQFVMIRLVSPRELGLYAVAVTVASIPGFLISAVGTFLHARVAAGEADAGWASIRLTVATTALMLAGIAAVSPVVIPFVFGEQFSDAVPLVWILALGIVPLGLGTMLYAVLVARGVPIASTFGEVGALLVTIAGLLLLLPSLGATGAAIVSVAAYGVNAAVLMWFVRRRLGTNPFAYLVPRRSDMALVRRLLRNR